MTRFEPCVAKIEREVLMFNHLMNFELNLFFGINAHIYAYANTSIDNCRHIHHIHVCKMKQIATKSHKMRHFLFAATLKYRILVATISIIAIYSLDLGLFCLYVYLFVRAYMATSKKNIKMIMTFCRQTHSHTHIKRSLTLKYVDSVFWNTFDMDSFDVYTLTKFILKKIIRKKSGRIHCKCLRFYSEWTTTTTTKRVQQSIMSFNVCWKWEKNRNCSDKSIENFKWHKKYITFFLTMSWVWECPNRKYQFMSNALIQRAQLD